MFMTEYPREVLYERINRRVDIMFDEGLCDEVKALLDNGVPRERLLRYGLEYKHVARYLTEDYSYDEMYTNLYTDIRRFSKRQMTWFRRMERNGVDIRWLEGADGLDSNRDKIIEMIHASV